MVVAAVMTAAAVIAAYMVFPMMMVVMITPYIRVEIQLVIQKSSNSNICITRDTSIQFDASLCQCHLRSTANAATNQYICVQCRKNACQRTMTAAIGINDLRSNNYSVVYIIDLKLFGVTKMLKDVPVIIGNCDSHIVSPCIMPKYLLPEFLLFSQADLS